MVRIAPLFALALTGCGPAWQVWWDASGPDDLVGDIAVAIVTLGTVSSTDDRPVVEALHATGTALRMDLSASNHRSATGWTATSLNPDICAISPVATDEDALSVLLSFSRAGATDLFVSDADGEVIDWQPIEIRDPAGAQIFPYDAVAVGVTDRVEQLDVLAGSGGSVVLTWLDARKNPLMGTGLLAVGTTSSDLVLTAADPLSGYPFESFDLVVGDSFAAASSISIAAGDEALVELPVVPHDPSEITAVELQVREEEVTQPEEDTGEPGTAGTLRARVLAGETDLFGVDVTWTDDGEAVGKGTWARYEGEGEDDVHEIVACRGEICDTVEVPGHITATYSSFVPEDSCACSSGSAAAPGLLLGALAAAFTRRRPG